MAGLIGGLMHWVSEHPDLAGLIVSVVACAESLAVVGLVVPGAAVMLAAGALIGAGGCAVATALVYVASYQLRPTADWDGRVLQAYLALQTPAVERRAAFFTEFLNTKPFAVAVLIVLVAAVATGGVRTAVAAAAIFALALVGFGFKAGLMPLHLWLPDAHAAAPSHVSALLSGVMIKAGIYGLVRVTGFFTAVPPWWGGLLLAIGAVSGVLVAGAHVLRCLRSRCRVRQPSPSPRLPFCSPCGASASVPLASPAAVSRFTPSTGTRRTTCGARQAEPCEYRQRLPTVPQVVSGLCCLFVGAWGEICKSRMSGK